MSEMTQETAMRILNSRKIIAEAGKYSVKVVNVNLHNEKHIVNFAAMNMYQAKNARTALNEGKIQDSVNSNLTTSVFDGKWVPAKGDVVNIMVEEIKTKKGDMALLVTSMSEVKVSNKIIDFDFSAEAEAGATLVASEVEFQEEK